MIVLSVSGLRKYYGPEPVLDGVAFDIRPGERVALVGPNGAGKTTLMKIIAGREDADAGKIDLHGAATLAYLEQQPEFPRGRTVMEIAREGLADLARLSHEADAVARQLAAAPSEQERNRLGKQFDLLQHELQQRDAYHVEHRVHSVLHGLGFHEDAYAQPVEQLSGGQQNRLLLAQLLLAEANLLLLDEPSNHLDIQATEWLEDHLASSQQAMILVSHDRYLLDRVANRTLELFRGTAESYAGNFSAYWRQKAERLDVQRRTYEKQQEEIARLQDFIRRNSYGQKHAQAEDRRKKLERIEPVPVPREIAAPPMGFPKSPQRPGDVVLRVEHLAKSYEQPLFRDLTFQFERGEKWGILGPNGCGKTTLLRCLMNLAQADEGRILFGANVKAAYFDQLLSFPDLQTQVVEAIRPDHKEFNEPQRREMLARFGLTGDIVFQKLNSLSGGERNRAALARLAALDANLLILDEPTNHLDLWARAALERAIKAFEGTVLFVSHDRYFLNQVADHLLIVEPGRFREIGGNYDFYKHLVGAGLAAGEAASARERSKRDGKEIRNASADVDQKPAKRKRKFPYRKVPDIEAEIAQRESRIEQLHFELATPDVFRDPERIKAVNAEIDEHHQALPVLYEHWEEAVELN